MKYRCGGFSSYTGHCGATDCEDCYPGCSAYSEDDQEVETVEANISITLKLDATRFPSQDAEIQKALHEFVGTLSGEMNAALPDGVEIDDWTYRVDILGVGGF